MSWEEMLKIAVAAGLCILAARCVAGCAPKKPPEPWDRQEEHCAVYEFHKTGKCFMVVKGQTPTPVSCDRRCPGERPP